MTATDTEPDMGLSFVDDLVRRIGAGPETVIPILQGIQNHYRYLPREALRRVCDLTQITPAAIMGVSTFYDQFRHTPAGQYTIKVCIGTACHVKGAPVVHDAFCEHLHIASGEDTDSQGRFTVAKVACLGCCTLAPAVQIGDVTYGHLTAETVPHVLRDFLALEQRRAHRRPRGPGGAGGAGEIRISMDTCCLARGSGEVYEALDAAAEATGVGVTVKAVGCAGMSYMEPLVEVDAPGQPTATYCRVRADDAAEIVRRHFRPEGLAARVRLATSRLLDQLLTDEAWEPVTRYAVDVRDPEVAAFRDCQVRVATEHSGRTHPTDPDEYIAAGGFEALTRCLRHMSPEEVIEQVRRSGLRGRGGAGFTTGAKWSGVRAAGGGVKYVVCNGDEGDPGSFMDRMLLESHPYRVIEGMAIAAYAVGAEEGYVYVRAEYPLAVERLGQALDRCRAAGVVGDDVLGTGRRLDLRIMQGAGAFVCGEETALLASIEGRRGMPRLRPPYPARRGLWGKPTCVNNVETFACVPWILRHGPEAFAALGTDTSRGTKVFALAGKVVRGGLIEVPMGITLRQIVEDIGGGIADGQRLKAVQVGGPSGGCIPERLADTPVDYEALTAAGAMMGSGGMVVLDESDCMVDIARYFLQFTQNQSCGKCTPCRVGTRRMLEILDRLCDGAGRDGDIEQLEDLARTITASSLCGLGATAPNPVLSTIAHFRDEYAAHIAGRCPAGVCKALITYSITDDCIGCTRCAQHCPADAIEMRPYEKHEIDPDKCVRCGTCLATCPADAVKVE